MASRWVVFALSLMLALAVSGWWQSAVGQQQWQAEEHALLRLIFAEIQKDAVFVTTIFVCLDGARRSISLRDHIFYMGSARVLGISSLGWIRG
jgi:hypothetical protein